MKTHFFKPMFLSLVSFSALSLSAQSVETFKLYPQGVPESNGIQASETFDGRVVENVSDPELSVFSPRKENNRGVAILICPGGGYIKEAIVHEGNQVAEWLSTEGITGFVLKYRLPNGNKEIPLADVRQAMTVIRKNADQLGINPGKIGITGFSAGGHLASTAGTHLKEEVRPDFMILFYPVISMKDSITHNGSRSNLLGSKYIQADIDEYSNEKRITPATPPTLLFLSDDDKAVSPLNSTFFYEALKQNKVKSSLYIFPNGGHGWGYNTTFQYHELWKKLMLEWLKDIGILLPG